MDLIFLSPSRDGPYVFVDLKSLFTICGLSLETVTYKLKWISMPRWASIMAARVNIYVYSPGSPRSLTAAPTLHNVSTSIFVEIIRPIGRLQPDSHRGTPAPFHSPGV